MPAPPKPASSTACAPERLVPAGAGPGTPLALLLLAVAIACAGRIARRSR